MEDQLLRFNVPDDIPSTFFLDLKKNGYSDAQIAWLMRVEEKDVTKRRKELDIRRVYKMVDTCAAEFESHTNYFYSTFDDHNESVVTDRKKIVVLGSGPNRIGQGIEFDYCCVHGIMAIKEAGYEAIMVNCNPETVSTDFDIADKLYFEPVFWEHLEEILEHEKPEGVIVQLGGQTALKLADDLHRNGWNIIGTSFPDIGYGGGPRSLLRPVERPRHTLPEVRSCQRCRRGPGRGKRNTIPPTCTPVLCVGGATHEDRDQRRRAGTPRAFHFQAHAG